MIKVRGRSSSVKPRYQLYIDSVLVLSNVSVTRFNLININGWNLAFPDKIPR